MPGLYGKTLCVLIVLVFGDDVPHPLRQYGRVSTFSAVSENGPSVELARSKIFPSHAHLSRRSHSEGVPYYAQANAARHVLRKSRPLTFQLKGDSRQLVSLRRTTGHNSRDVDVDNQLRAPRLFCWSVVVPHTSEIQFLETHWKKNMLFGCDGYAVYSNVTAEELLHGVDLGGVASNVASHLEKAVFQGGHAVKGAMPMERPVPTFMQVWNTILHVGAYKSYDWVVKIDMDTVFLPERLRLLLGRHREPGAVYLSNEEDHIYGPIEVFSSKAVALAGDNWEKCESLAESMLDAEDSWLTECFRMLNIKVLPEPLLLQDYEANCDPNVCHTAGVVAFHGCKQHAFADACLEQAATATVVIKPEVDDGDLVP